MNYEVKSIAPGSVFFNAVRIFLVVGFIVGVISFFIVPNPNIHIEAWWQKILATLLFTLVYSVVVSIVLTLMAWLYNLFAGSFNAGARLDARRIKIERYRVDIPSIERLRRPPNIDTSVIRLHLDREVVTVR